jgi:ferrous iron transport protein B
VSDCHGCSNCGPVAVAEPPAAARALAGSRVAVALIGPPNSGKTTLFNRLTGLRQKVGNFPGVTVEQHTGVAALPDGRSVRIIDLPGVYSLQPRSEDERVARDVLTGNSPGTDKPQAVLLVLDSTNLSRQLMLAAPILAIGLPTLVILNLADDLKTRGGKVDTMALSAQLGAPVALVSARRGEGMEQVYEFLAGALPKPLPVLLPVLQDVPHCRRWAGDVGSKAGYRAPGPDHWTRRLDEILLHPVMGPLAFLLVVVAVFQVVFSVGAPLHDIVQDGFDKTEGLLVAMMPESLFRSVLIEGVWRGVGSVLAFLPQILILFLFIGVLEDSGYLARAAVIADRSMARVGLQGKSFIPLLSAYSCAVPAIMATRTIENKRDRIATILIAPFMTCSARLPAYGLIIMAFIPARALLGPLLGLQTAVMLGLYLLGFLAAVATAKLLKSTVLKSARTPFLMEMPSYRWPSLHSLGLRLFDRGMVFVKQAGSVILIVTVILAILLHFPYSHGKPPEIGNSIAGMIGHGIEPLIKPMGFNWKIGIGLITSLVARETMPATLGTIYGAEHESAAPGLQASLQHDLSLGGAVALLVFFAFALQCMSTMAVVRRETGSWKWPIAQFAYMGALASIGAFVAFHLIG